MTAILKLATLFKPASVSTTLELNAGGRDLEKLDGASPGRGVVPVPDRRDPCVPCWCMVVLSYQVAVLHRGMSYRKVGLDCYSSVSDIRRSGRDLEQTVLEHPSRMGLPAKVRTDGMCLFIELGLGHGWRVTEESGRSLLCAYSTIMWLPR